MLATLQTAPVLDRAGLPKITQRAMLLRRDDGETIGRQVFNPHSTCSRLNATDRLIATARTLGVTVSSR